MKCGSFSGLAFDRYIPAMGHGNAVDHRQTQASPFADSSRRIEWLKDSAQVAAIYAVPCIANAQPDISAHPEVGVVSTELLVDSAAIENHSDRTTSLIKCLVGIATQIHD